MRQFFIYFTIIVIAAITLTSPVISTALMNFLFLGIVPGLDTPLTFWVILPAVVLISLILIRWITSQPLYIGNMQAQEKTARTLARKNVARTVAKNRSSLTPRSTRSRKKQYRTAKT